MNLPSRSLSIPTRSSDPYSAFRARSTRTIHLRNRSHRFISFRLHATTVAATDPFTHGAELSSFQQRYRIYSNSRQRLYGSHLHRKAFECARIYLSTIKGPTKVTSEETNKEAASEQILAPKQKLSRNKQLTDPDFVSYLTGEMKPPVEPLPPKARRRRTRRFLEKDPDLEFYNRIQHIQDLKKEQHRMKTATNVYRALWGNVIICVAKFGAWTTSGSSGMLAEFIHSVVDCGNQALLLVGLSSSSMSADRKHPYGYGKNIYFFALISALGTFFMGAGVSMTNAVGDLMNPHLQEITWPVWSVLSLSFAVDGYVLTKTVSEIRDSQPPGLSFWKHLSNIREPATLAVLLEDGAACLGVVMAFGGIAASHATGNPIFDGLAGVGISSLLGMVGLALVRMNQRFLLGQAVDKEITDGIEKILVNRRSIDGIGSVQSQWISSETFSYKAEVDFDGTYLAAKLMPIYQQEFLQIRDSMEEELQVLLSLYAEDVMRTVEREVRHVEGQIRKKYPGAEYIELEPMSLDVDRLAIDDNLEAELRRVESDALNRYLKSLKKEAASNEPSGTTTTPSPDKKKD